MMVKKRKKDLLFGLAVISILYKLKDDLLFWLRKFLWSLGKQDYPKQRHYDASI